jgi:type I restriction enzyme S subunit
MTVLDRLSRPRTWRSVPFGRVAMRTKESGRPDLSPLSVFLGAGVVPRDSRDDNHNQLGEDLGKYLVVKPGDLVFNKLRTWQGGLGASQYEGIVSPAYFVCRPHADYDSRFLQYLLLSDAYLQELTRVSKWQPPSQFDIGWEQLRVVPIMSPDVLAQRAIADYLDRETARIDVLIIKKQRLIEVLKERRQVLITVAVAGGPAPESGQMRSEHWSLPHEWNESRVDRLADVKARVGWKALTASEYVDEGYVFLSTPNIKQTEIDFENVNYITEFRYEESPELKLQIGDVLLVKDGATLGITNIVRTLPRPATVNGSIAVLRCKSIEPSYLRYVLASDFIQGRIGAYRAGMGVPHLFQEDIKKFPVPCPPPSTQRAIADYLDRETARVDDLVDKVNTQIGLLREHRQALITGAVTGEIEIPGVAA